MSSPGRGVMHAEKCNFCRGWLRTVVRVFPSYEDFRNSRYYGGAGDFLINDPYATRAVWPGKTNADRSVEDWWICTPVHPFCSCHWASYSPEEEESLEWLKDFREESSRVARENAEAFERDRDALREERYKSETALFLARELSRLREMRRSRPFERSLHVVKGLYHARSCAGHGETGGGHAGNDPSWTRKYLRRWQEGKESQLPGGGN